jgi:hypothetical protein
MKEIARFSSRIEAETVAHALDQYDIPYLIQGLDPMYGMQSYGSATGGLVLCVPDEAVDDVRKLLNCVVESEEPPISKPE